MERGDRVVFRRLRQENSDLTVTKVVDGVARIDQDGKRMWRSALRYSALGLEMGVAVAIGYGLGWWLDKRFGTKPYLMLVMLLLGIAAGFRGLIRAAKEAERESQAEDEAAKKRDAKDDDAKP